MRKTIVWLKGASLAAGVLLACPADSASGADIPASVHPELWPQVQRSLPADPGLEARIDSLLAGMTLEQKVGQLIQADIDSITVEDLRHYPLGSVLNGGNSGPGNDDLAPASEWLAAADRFYAASIDPSHGQHPIPTLWGTDAVHGHNNIIGATIFPHNIGLGATRDPELIRRIGEVTATEVRVTGQDWSFGPTLAVVRDARWGRTYESYSENPQIVRSYAAAMVTGLQGKPGTAQFLDAAHVIATPKHFLGDGGTGGRDQGDNRSSEAELRDIDGAGYPPALSAGAQAVMVSFSSWQGVKLSANRGLLTDVLKGRMQFDGLVIGDWNAHGQVPGCTNFSCAAAINAGIDVLMAPDSWKPLFGNTLGQARSGEIPATRLDDAVRRVLRVKLRAHLLEEGKPSSRPLAGHFELLGSAEHRAVARQAVRESLVLLKNRNHLLPLSPHAHVLVAGDGADNIPKQCGGWTLSWQGTGITNKDFPHGESIFSGIQAAVHAGGGTAELSPAGGFQRPPDVAIVVFGENPYAEFQGDIGTVEYSPGDKHDLQLLRRLHARGIPVVAVFISGRPLWVNPEINASDAFVAAWLPGSEGGGVADVLFRAADGHLAHDFHGKLSFSWPRTPQPTAANAVRVAGMHETGRSANGTVGHRGAGGDMPLFPYGYGLTYASNGDLGALPENPGTPPVTQVDARTFFAAGRPGSGWQWSAGASVDAAALREIPGGVGMAVDGRVRLAATDHSAQEDARRLSWSGGGPAIVGLAGKSPIDLQRESNGQLSLGFDYRVDQAPTADVSVLMECGAGCRAAVPVTAQLGSSPAGQWRHLKIPLACFAHSGANMSRISAPFYIATAGQLQLSVAAIHLESGTDGLLDCAH
jgi:beta-glucosidase